MNGLTTLRAWPTCVDGMTTAVQMTSHVEITVFRRLSDYTKANYEMAAVVYIENQI